MTEEANAPAVAKRAVPGERCSKLLDFLLKEKVGNELLFTTDLATRAVPVIGVSKYTDVYNLLRTLEKNKKIFRRKNATGTGFILTFGEERPKTTVTKKSDNHVPTVQLTLSELASRLDKEIQTMGQELEHKKNQRKLLGELMKEVR